MIQIADKTKVADLSVGELRSVIEAVVKETIAHNTKATAHGIQGLADVLGCSVSQAKRVKASGLLQPAISQLGRVMVVDTEMALELWRRASHSSRKPNRLS